MSKEIQMTKPEENRMPRAVLFVILSSSLIRHSSFGFRHSYSRTSRSRSKSMS